jgi:hypothetical protein
LRRDYQSAISDCNKAIALQPSLADAYATRGWINRRTSSYFQAAADYTRAIELSPSFAEAYVGRATAEADESKYSDAIADYDKAIQLMPEADASEAHYGRAGAYVHLGDKQRAIDDFRIAVRSIREGNQLSSDALKEISRLEDQLAADRANSVSRSHRVALVIGNSAYRNVAQLANPANDARLILDALKQDGFTVTIADNLDRDGLVRALRAFGNDADAADWAVVYFAGHGIEVGGTNYLIPVDAKLVTDRDIDFEAVPLDQVMRAIDGAHLLRVVILDACRKDPFATTMRQTGAESRAIGRGLARIEPARGTLVVYSAKEGTIAADGDGPDSPFATALAQHLTEAGIEADKMFRLVRDDVLDATGNKQEPFMYGSLPGRQNFYFSER